MKITIIGANSFIARNLIYLYKKKINDVEFYLYDYQEAHLDNESNYYQIYVTEKSSCAKINYDVDLIYLFSGKTGTLAGFDDYISFIQINELSLLNILSCYKDKGASAKIIFPSTRLVYKGDTKPINEDGENEFKTIYAVNKFACEQYLKMYNKIYGINYLVFRICVPYGSLIPNISSYGTAEFMLQKAKNGEDITLFGDGQLRRTIVSMQDLCNALIVGSLNKKCINDIYNIGGENYSLLEMAKLIADKYKVGITFIPWPESALKVESGDTVFNSSKFDALNNFKYVNTFVEMLEKGYL